MNYVRHVSSRVGKKNVCMPKRSPSNTVTKMSDWLDRPVLSQPLPSCVLSWISHLPVFNFLAFKWRYYVPYED